MTESELRPDRLLHLAKFLREVLPAKTFDFGRLMEEGSKNPVDALAAGGGCGTLGCAIGWMPAAFPDQLHWARHRYCSNLYNVVDNKGNMDFTAARDFLGISTEEVYWLFDPDHSTGSLGEGASKEEVAQRIEEFVAERQTLGAEFSLDALTDSYTPNEDN